MRPKPPAFLSLPVGPVAHSPELPGGVKVDVAWIWDSANSRRDDIVAGIVPAAVAPLPVEKMKIGEKR